MSAFLLIIALLLLAIQLFFWMGVFSRFGSSSKEKASLPPLSVIICARNEAPALEANLPRILEQEYPDFEVIVIDHASTDLTDEVLRSLSASFSHLRTFKHSDPRPGKKGPLSTGWQEANYEWLVVTDADCQPASPAWLRHMARHMSPQHDFVLGYGGYYRQPGLLNRLIRYETVLTALQYVSYTRSGLPYMGVGRNLAYRKAMVEDLPLQTLKPKLLSGDDDLLVAQMAKAGRVGICLYPNGFTYSMPATTWPAYLRQKQRHVSTASSYKTWPRWWLTLWGGSQFLWPIAVIALVFFAPGWALACYLLRLIPAWWQFSRASQVLQEKDLAPWFPFLDLLLSLQYGILIPTSMGWIKQDKWKGRPRKVDAIS